MKTSKLYWLVPVTALLGAMVVVGITYLLPGNLSSSDQANLRAAQSTSRLLVELDSTSRDLVEAMDSATTGPRGAAFGAISRKAQKVRSQVEARSGPTAQRLGEALAFVSLASRDLQRVVPAVSESNSLAAEAASASGPNGGLSVRLGKSEATLTEASESTQSAREKVQGAVRLFQAALGGLSRAAEEEGDDSALDEIEGLRRQIPALAITLETLEVQELRRAKRFLVLSADLAPPKPVAPRLVSCPQSDGPPVAMIEATENINCDDASRVATSVPGTCPPGWSESASGCMIEEFQCVKTGDQYEGIDVRCEATETRFITFYMGG